MTDKAIDAMARAICCPSGCLGVPAPDCPCDGSKNTAQSALTALQDAGLAIVPVEPTDRMLWDGQDSYGDKFYFKAEHAANCYRAMIAASKGEG